MNQLPPRSSPAAYGDSDKTPAEGKCPGPAQRAGREGGSLVAAGVTGAGLGWAGLCPAGALLELKVGSGTCSPASPVPFPPAGPNSRSLHSQILGGEWSISEHLCAPARWKEGEGEDGWVK